MDDFIFGASSTLCAVSNYEKKLIIVGTGGKKIEILAGGIAFKDRWGLARSVTGGVLEPGKIVETAAGGYMYLERHD